MTTNHYQEVMLFKVTMIRLDPQRLMNHDLKLQGSKLNIRFVIQHTAVYLILTEYNLMNISIVLYVH